MIDSQVLDKALSLNTVAKIDAYIIWLENNSKISLATRSLANKILMTNREILSPMELF